MAQARRIAVFLPEDLLASIDVLASQDECSRSAFVREALRFLVRQRRRSQANLERLRRGYELMGRLNRELAEEGLAGEIGAMDSYERALGECD